MMTTTKILILVGIIAIVGIYFVSCKPAQEVVDKTKTDVKDVVEEPAEEPVETAIVGEDCVYRDIQGIATITHINTANPNEVIIKYNFSPVDKVAYKYPKFSDEDIKFFVKGHGSFPPHSWVKAQKIKMGGEYRCVRKELEKGTCTPVVFAFPQYEKNGWNK